MHPTSNHMEYRVSHPTPTRPVKAGPHVPFSKGLAPTLRQAFRIEETRADPVPIVQTNHGEGRTSLLELHIRQKHMVHVHYTLDGNNITRSRMAKHPDRNRLALPTRNDKHVETLAGIVRACIFRVIWLERNFRILNPNSEGKPHCARANQAVMDIAAHIGSAKRRLPSAAIEKITSHTNWLSTNDDTYVYRRLLSGRPLISPPSSSQIT